MQQLQLLSELVAGIGSEDLTNSLVADIDEVVGLIEEHRVVNVHGLGGSLSFEDEMSP